MQNEETSSQIELTAQKVEIKSTQKVKLDFTHNIERQNNTKLEKIKNLKEKSMKLKILNLCTVTLLSVPLLFASEAPLEWSDLVTTFTAAFNSGDVERLEQLRASQYEHGFANIDDLGEKFFKYGAGMDNWEQLISDAKKNASN